jgi:hypothetical protein
VAEAVRHGMTNRLIAQRQGRSLDAVKFHVANALQKLGFSSRAELRRWSGVRADSLLFHKEPSMNTAVSLGPIGQISRSVSDVEAAVRWYGEVLGLRHLYTFESSPSSIAAACGSSSKKAGAARSRCSISASRTSGLRTRTYWRGDSRSSARLT